MTDFRIFMRSAIKEVEAEISKPTNTFLIKLRLYCALLELKVQLRIDLILDKIMAGLRLK